MNKYLYTRSYLINGEYVLKAYGIIEEDWPSDALTVAHNIWPLDKGSGYLKDGSLFLREDIICLNDAPVIEKSFLD